MHASKTRRGAELTFSRASAPWTRWSSVTASAVDGADGGD
ncbi:proteasome component [Mycobacterium marseillense]|uniref:Proteasome component n=1 Tax=Mycobacterium marseillense TaxID=701042 RepID=A0AAC9VUM4_9MYCO|nr:proteasome component [Mycobacterium marseillense]